METQKFDTVVASPLQKLVRHGSQTIEKIKYWSWKNWYLANFKYNSPARFIAELRITAVYDLKFKEGGMKAVREEHASHLISIKAKMDA